MHKAFESPEPLGLFPEKIFYKIGEASKITGLESYVLRYWETEFPFLNPRKTRSGQRTYTKKDVDLVLQIKKLLYEEKYTIDGVRRKLGGNIEHTVKDPVDEVKQYPDADTGHVIELVKKRLRELLQTLS